MFSDNLLANLIKDKKEIIEIQNSIEINYLNYFPAKWNYNFSNYLLPIVFLRDLYEKKLSKNDDDEEKSILYNETERAKHGRIPDKKRKLFLKNITFPLNGR